MVLHEASLDGVTVLNGRTTTVFCALEMRIVLQHFDTSELKEGKKLLSGKRVRHSPALRRRENKKK